MPQSICRSWWPKDSSSWGPAKWDQTVPQASGGMQTKKGTAEAIIDDIKNLDWVVVGVSFMKVAIHHIKQQRKESAIQGGRFTNSQG